MTYKIHSGDTLSSIATRFHTSVSALLKANPEIKNPNVIYAGTSLSIPGSKDEFTSHKKATHHKSGSSTKSSGSSGSPKASGTYGEPWKPGKGQLKGADTSAWQSGSTFESSIKGSQFSMIKASQGTGWTDPTFRARWNELGKKIQQGKMSLRVAYCFLDKGNGAAQAKHFLDAVGVHGKLPAGTRLALDWEASALQSPQTLRDAANYIHKVTGLWPLVYTSASNVAEAKKMVPNAPMWEAKWTNGLSTKNVPFVQYSDGPGFDHDVFNGDLKALRQFAGFKA